MTEGELTAFPCPECGAAAGAPCPPDQDEHIGRTELAAAHRVRAVCSACGAPAGRWCYCVKRMDAAQPQRRAAAVACPVVSATSAAPSSSRLTGSERRGAG